MKSELNFLRLPHFFLFKDLFYSHLESKKILNDIKNGKEDFKASEVEPLAKHYLILFEVLEFLHEYTPDFFVINKINDLDSEIVCFANKEFAQTFNLKNNPEGQDIIKLLHPNEEKAFIHFIQQEIVKAKTHLTKSKEKKVEVSVKTDSILLPVIQSVSKKLYEVHLRLTGSVKEVSGKAIFDGYSIILGRNVTDSEVQKQIAESFTNIPEVMHEDFYEEAARRKILKKERKKIPLHGAFVLTGNSDICGSSDLRLEAEAVDKINNNHKAVQSLNAEIDNINSFLHQEWRKAKQQMLKKTKAVFLFEETDGMDYSICLSEDEKQRISANFFKELRKDEVNILLEIAQKSKERDFPLKHLIVAHNKKVDFYFEERFENKFKVETHSVDFFIKKRRLEKACDRADGSRIVEENCITVAVDTEEDFQFYKKIFLELEQEAIFTSVEEGEVEFLQGVTDFLFVRGRLK